MKSSSVALYLRKSREEETETREATLARHERMLLDYCAHNGLTVAETYREVVSGESLDAVCSFFIVCSFARYTARARIFVNCR